VSFKYQLSVITKRARFSPGYPDLTCVMFQIQLPNRLGKMLAPLHWHDYKRKYGKLDDFVGSHPEVSS